MNNGFWIFLIFIIIVGLIFACGALVANYHDQTEQISSAEKRSLQQSEELDVLRKELAETRKQLEEARAAIQVLSVEREKLQQYADYQVQLSSLVEQVEQIGRQNQQLIGSVEKLNQQAALSRWGGEPPSEPLTQNTLSEFGGLYPLLASLGSVLGGTKEAFGIIMVVWLSVMSVLVLGVFVMICVLYQKVQLQSHPGRRSAHFVCSADVVGRNASSSSLRAAHHQLCSFGKSNPCEKC